MNTYHSSTGTAADLLTYNRYQDPGGVERLSRVATANEEWIVGDWDGERYCIRFASNFAKKHLFTFSKKTEWRDNDAEKHASLYNKLKQVMDVRYHIRVCKLCLHPDKKHKTGSGVPCDCKAMSAAPPALCGCKAGQPGQPALDLIEGSHVNAYFRSKAGKPDHDVLSGAWAEANTAIVLNYVPRAEFEAVVVASIRAHEKPPGWSRGDPLAGVVGTEYTLVWDFGPARNGVIVTGDPKTHESTWPRHQRCEVKARKTASSVGWQTWVVGHFHKAG